MGYTNRVTFIGTEIYSKIQQWAGVMGGWNLGVRRSTMGGGITRLANQRPCKYNEHIFISVTHILFILR